MNKRPLANAIYVEMVLTGARKAAVDQAGTFLRLIDYCQDGPRQGEQPAKKLSRQSSSEPAALEASAVRVAAKVLDYEVAHSFSYHSIGRTSDAEKLV